MVPDTITPVASFWPPVQNCPHRYANACINYVCEFNSAGFSMNLRKCMIKTTQCDVSTHKIMAVVCPRLHMYAVFFVCEYEIILVWIFAAMMNMFCCSISPSSFNDVHM